MKKIVYLCGMMLLSMNIMAQIDLDDKNWDTVFYDDFTTNRSWRSSDWYSVPDLYWKAHPGSKVTHGNLEFQIYQYDHCLFDINNGMIKLIAEYDINDSIKFHHYALPDTMHGNYPNTYGQNDGLYFFSGEIDTKSRFRYGFFEIRCKLPIHQGAFPAFWLYSSNGNGSDKYYEEIDIFEYTWSIAEIPNHINNPSPNGIPDYYTITNGIYFSDTSLQYSSFARKFPTLPETGTDLSHWHTYSCEWLPEKVIWYCDGQVVNEFYETQNIPHRPLTLKTNYAINRHYKHGETVWQGPESMDIDYICVCQLHWDCDTDEIITCQSDLDSFDYAVKRTITITSTVGQPIVSNIDKITFRVNESFAITGPFEVENGAEFTILMQACPESN